MLWSIRNNDRKVCGLEFCEDNSNMVQRDTRDRRDHGVHGLKRKEKEGKPRTSFCHGMQFLPICGDLLQNCPVLQKQLPLVLVVSSVVIFREAITSKPFIFWVKPAVQTRKPGKLYSSTADPGSSRKQIFSGWNFNCVEICFYH